MRAARRRTYLLPSAFTAGNLLCGFFSVVSTMRNDMALASWLIVVAALLDFMDGKVALYSNTQSRFGVELDSLADLVSFGVAPGIIMYQFFLRVHGEWSWMVSFLFVLCGALRLARFNVEAKGPDKTKFKGLPIPMAAAALISFVPFSGTDFFQDFLQQFSYNRFLVFMMLLLAALMVSTIEYPATPRFRFNSRKEAIALIAFLAVVFILFYNWQLLLFPATVLYVGYGIARALLLGFLARLPEKNGD